MIKISLGSLKQKLSKSRNALKEQLTSIFAAQKINQELWDQIEEMLILADVGVETSLAIVEELKRASKEDKISDPALLWDVLEKHIENMISGYDFLYRDTPLVTLFVGVNGSGKTTTIGKIAKQEIDKGNVPLLVAGDTFRAAAIDQLKMISQKIGSQFIGSQRGADPSSVVYDAIHATKSRGAHHVLVDTAGRLQSYEHLMAELAKMRRVAERESANWGKVQAALILDATTGQNGLSQAVSFFDAVKIESIILTKLDGTAKGGILISIAKKLDLPVAYIGTGEAASDLVQFDPSAYASAIFGRD